jgi:hypothetical protein
MGSPAARFAFQSLGEENTAGAVHATGRASSPRKVVVAARVLLEVDQRRLAVAACGLPVKLACAWCGRVMPNGATLVPWAAGRASQPARQNGDGNVVVIGDEPGVVSDAGWDPCEWKSSRGAGRSTQGWRTAIGEIQMVGWGTGVCGAVAAAAGGGRRGGAGGGGGFATAEICFGQPQKRPQSTPAAPAELGPHVAQCSCFMQHATQYSCLV